MSSIRINKRYSHDSLSECYADFNLPYGKVYLCAHSLGLMHKNIVNVTESILTQQWGEQAVCAWEQSGWLDLPVKIGQIAASLLGANEDEVISGDSTSVTLFKLLMGAIDIQRGRNIILTDADNFPGDLYIAEAACRLHSEMKIVRTNPNQFEQVMNDSVSVVMLTEVNYRTGERYRIKDIVSLAKQYGALVIVDLSHSAGILSVDLNHNGIDFAVACGYKYLNGGPGAPAVAFIAKRHHQVFRTPLSGWMGHDEPFQFSEYYQAAPGIKQLLCGTPSVISMKPLQYSLEYINQHSITDIEQRSKALSTLMTGLMDNHCPQLTLVTPRDTDRRGGHLGYMHSEARQISHVLLQNGFICDYREPDLIRFGLSPFYTREQDIHETVEALSSILRGDLC